MINATKDTQEILMHVKYPKMVDESFDLETGQGWSRIIDETTAEIYNTVTEMRRLRALALRFNRALARGLAGDITGLDHYFRYHYYGKGSIRPLDSMVEKKVTEALLSAEYETPVETYEYPHLIQVKEKFGELRYYVDNLHDSLTPVVNLAERLCRYTCETCGTPGERRENLSWLRVLCDHHYEIAELNSRQAAQESMTAKEIA